MIPIYNDLEVHYTIEQELVLVGDITAQINTKYVSTSSNTLELPDVDAVPLGSIVVLDQNAGTGTINDRVSHYGLTDEGGTLNTVQCPAGEVVAVYLHCTYGRKQWVQLSDVLFIADFEFGSGGGGTGTVLEVFTVANIASRDLLPIGGNFGEVSDGDVSIVLDSDGQGTQQNYVFFTATGWIIGTELTSVYTETFFAADIASRDLLPTGVGVNTVSVGDNVIVADGDGAGTKMVFQWTGAIEGYVLVYSEGGGTVIETFTVADLAARDALIIGSGTGEVSNADTVKVLDYDGYGNVALYTYYTGDGYILTSTYGHEALLTLGAESKELTGFIDNDNILSSYNSTTRRVTLTHASGTIKYIWQNSVRSLVSPWISDPHPDVAGNYFLMMNDGENAVWLTVPWDFAVLPMAFVTYDSVAGIRMGVNETHGIMPYELHRTNHINIGTWKEKGTGTLTNGTFVLNDGTLDTSITPGVEEAAINDEDIRSLLPPLTQGNYTLHYLSGAGNTNILLDQPFPFRTSGTFAYANTLVNGTYLDVPLTNGDFFNVYCIFIPAMADATSQKYRYVFQAGQRVHTTLDSALLEQPYDLNIGDMGLLSNEFTIGFMLTYEARNAHTTTGKVALAEVTYIEGTRASLTATTSSLELSRALLDIADLTNEQTGFADNGNIDVSYDKITRTTTLTHPSGFITYIWRDRIRRLISPWVSDPHPDVAGNYILESVDGATFTWDALPIFDPLNRLTVAYVNYKLPTVNDIVALREVHGFMPYSTRHELHHLLGTWKEFATGKLTPGTYLVAPITPVDADNTPGVEATTIYDEDLPTNLSAAVQGTYTTHYLGVGGVSIFEKSSAFPFKVSGGNIIVANIANNGDYVNTEVPNGKYVNIYCIATPVTSDVDSQVYRYIWHIGQAVFDSLDLAISASPNDTNFGTIRDMESESCVLSKLTFKKHSGFITTGACRIENVQYFEGIQGALPVQPSPILPSHQHSEIDILGLPVTNNGAVEIVHGKVVGFDGTNYRLYTDATYAYVGINTNNDADVGNILHLRVYGEPDVIVINSASLSYGDPLRIDLATGSLTLYTPGERITPVVAMFIEDIDGTLGRVLLVTPMWPKRYPAQLTSMGVITPGSTNILEDDYEGGKLIFEGNESYLLRTRAKYKVPSVAQADFNTYRNADVTPIFSDKMTPSVSPDTYGNWQSTLTGLVSTSLFKSGDEVKFTDESIGTIDGEDLTIQLEFEERVLWNVRT